MKQILLLLTCIMSFAKIHSQIATSNGAILHFSTGALVQVNGGLNINNTSTFSNEGNLTVSKNSTLPLAGTITIQGTSSVSGNGMYRIEQDWINDASFNGGASTVELFGNTQQFITSTNNTVTTFNNLTLSGTGVGNNRKKTLTAVDARTGTNGILAIADRELETQTNDFIVLNTNAAAVTNTITFGSEGFVSSAIPGALIRSTNSTTAYNFPTGSSVGTVRYRPIILTPNNTNPTDYNVRLNNVDANSDGFNRSSNDNLICDANPNFYHAINRSSGTTPADITVFYIPANDGAWSGIAQWQNANTQWNDMNITAANTAGGFSTRTRLAWLFTNPGDPYILTSKRPDAPVLNCPEICENSTGNTFTAVGSGTTYTWTFPSNGTITSGQGSGTATADWTTGTGQVSVITTDASGCASLPSDCTPTVHVLPNVSFTYTTDGKEVFIDDQTVGSVTWDWDFDDGNLSNSNDPSHVYLDYGNYLVLLQVTDVNGCTNSTSQIIELMEDISVPNIITPNNDGDNDAFEVNTGSVTNYQIIIQNRWGNVVYESTDPTKAWDGKSNGILVAEGVYFYQIKLDKISKSIQFQGNVTVVY